MLVSDALDEFILSCKAEGLSMATVKWYTSLLGRFATVFEGRGVGEVTTHDLRAYLVGLREHTVLYEDAPQRPAADGQYAPETIIGHITALHRFFAWCAKEYDLPKNPMAQIRKPQRPKPSPRAVTESDYVALFNAAHELRDRALLAFLFETGCRLGGLISMQVDTVDLSKRRAYVTEKGGKRRAVYFKNFTAGLLEAWLRYRVGLTTSDAVWVSLTDGLPLTTSGIQQILKRLKRKAGVRGRANAHAFRHGFARAYITNGGDISTLAKILGHSDVNVTSDYYAVFGDDELQDFADKFGPESG